MMKLDLGPSRPGYVTPVFGAQDIEPLDARLETRLRRPMLIGGTVIGTLVIGLGVWASLTPLASGVTAPGEVQVEANLKTLRHKDGGVVRQIFVQEGQLVRANQPLITLDDTESRAMVEVLQNQADTLQAQAARAQAEATGKTAITFPPELMARASEPRVAGLMRDQQFLFATRLQLFQSQTSVLDQRIEQSLTQIEGDKAQIASVKDQSDLTDEEMSGYKTLYAKGYAPKQLIMRYQRSMADLAGKQGSLTADMARLRQQMGETRMQMTSVLNQRQSQAADEVRDAQTKLADVTPRLAAARQALDGTVIRAPVDGYVFNLTQYTQGGAVSPGEVLMQIVPSNAPLLVSAMVKPQDIGSVHMGMKAKVRISALNPRWHKPMDAQVVMVSPDKSSPAPGRAAGTGATGSEGTPPMSFYRINVRIDPKELTTLRPDEHVTPGMPASVTLVSGHRTLMSYLVSPITDTMDHAFHEQ